MRDVPKKCGCGDDYSINHSLTCKLGGYIYLRHNAVRDTAGELLAEVSKDVKIEPALLPVTGELLPNGSNLKDGARSDISCIGFWTPMSRAFFYVRVLNPMAETNRLKDIKTMYDQHEKAKKREYNARIIEIEKGSFCPLVFSCSGGMAPEANVFVKRLAEKYSTKKNELYSTTVSFIRRRFCFDILRSCLITLRGVRKNCHANAAVVADLDLELQDMELS